jgi:hypothetical protein
LPRVCVRDIREAGSHFEMREIGTIFVKGKIETTRIFELLSSTGELSEELVRLRERYKAARRSYLAQDWDAAEAAFGECLEIFRTTARLVSSLIEFKCCAETLGQGLDWCLASSR